MVGIIIIGVFGTICMLVLGIWLITFILRSIGSAKRKNDAIIELIEKQKVESAPAELTPTPKAAKKKLPHVTKPKSKKK